jgi:ABC-2 type transport system permease protein
MRGFIEIFKMDFKNLIRNPVLVGYNTVFSILLTLIMGFLTSGAYANPTDAYNYYAVSFLIYCMLSGAMTSTNCFMERDIKKPNLRIIHSPVGSFPIYFSKIVSSFLFDYICHLLVILILTLSLYLNFGGANIGYIILLMAPIEFAASALGVFFCCIFKTEEAASTLLSNAISILAFLGGTFFSFDGMGGVLAFASRLSPVKWMNDTFFSIIYDADISLVLPLFAGSVVVSAVLVFGCSKLFKTEDYLC